MVAGFLGVGRVLLGITFWVWNGRFCVVDV